MKRSALLFILIVLGNIVANAQWRKVSTGTRANISDICFIDNLTGYAVGDKTILKTIDGGNKWQVVIKNKTFHNITDILIKGDSVHCYGHHDNGQYYRINFENNGTQFLKKIINYRPYHPQYVGEDVWFVQDGNLRRLNGDTSDFIMGKVKDFDVRDGHVAVIADDKVFTSSDMGENWKVLPFPAVSGSINNCYFDGTDTVHAITQYPTVLYTSFDGGSTWRAHKDKNVSGYYFVDRTKLLTMSELPTSNIAYSSLRQNTVLASTNFNARVSKCYFKNSRSGYAFGDNGVIYRCLKLPEDQFNDPYAETTVFNEVLYDELLFPEEEMFTIETDAKENPKRAKELNLSGLDILKGELYDMDGKLVKTYERGITLLDFSDIEFGMYKLILDIIPPPNGPSRMEWDIKMKRDNFIIEIPMSCKTALLVIDEK